MPQIEEYRPRNLSEYIALVEKLQRRAGHALWFRGIGRVGNLLVPSLYRHPKVKSHSDLCVLERQLMTRFRQRALPYHSRNLSDDWEALFFMQHYGLPTRLLDWTENPLTGLHFALMSAPSKSSANLTLKYTKPAAVWILDPVAWNQAALKHVSYTGGPLAPGDEALKGYSAEAIATAINTHPVALFGAHNSARIVAQQGVFTIFGTNRDSMETLVKDGTLPAKVLACVVIPPSRIGTIRKSLLNQGITESAIFPDLEGLARETKRHFGFEV